jgi:hypothetical protein
VTVAVAELKDVDRGWREAIRTMTEAAKLPSAHVVVGWPEKAGLHGSGPMTVAEIAALHEFGLGVPRRSMLAATFELNAAKYSDAMRKIGNGVTTGRIDVRRGLDLLGIMVVGDVQKRIAAGIAPPNSPRTIKQKGSSIPLIATGQMRQALDHEVRGA